MLQPSAGALQLLVSSQQQPGSMPLCYPGLPACSLPAPHHPYKSQPLTPPMEVLKASNPLKSTGPPPCAGIAHLPRAWALATASPRGQPVHAGCESGEGGLQPCARWEQMGLLWVKPPVGGSTTAGGWLGGLGGRACAMPMKLQGGTGRRGGEQQHPWPRPRQLPCPCPCPRACSRSGGRPCCCSRSGSFRWSPCPYCFWKATTSSPSATCVK